MSLPRWECRDQADIQRLREWTIEQLRADETSALDVMRMADAEFATSVEKDATRVKDRGRVVRRIKFGDAETLTALTADPELRRLAFARLSRKRPRGRERGDPRPSDLPRDTRLMLSEASDDVDRIRALWLHHFRRRNRKEAPTAIDIAAALWGVDPAALINYRKNRHRV